MNKIIIAVIVILVVVISGYFLFKSGYQPTSSVSQPLNEQVNSQEISQPPVEQTPDETQNTETGNIITYTDSGYSPNTITIKNGQTVIFKNQSSKSMWPASAMHPTHRLYDGTSIEEHCSGTRVTSSSFDACSGVQPGNSWSFRFNKTGSWKYHDHLSPTNFGAIIVE